MEKKRFSFQQKAKMELPAKNDEQKNPKTSKKQENPQSLLTRAH